MNNLWCTNYSSVRTNTRFTVPLVHHYITESPLVLGVGSLSCIFSEIKPIHQVTMIISKCDISSSHDHFHNIILTKKMIIQKMRILCQKDLITPLHDNEKFTTGQYMRPKINVKLSFTMYTIKSVAYTSVSSFFYL